MNPPAGRDEKLPAYDWAPLAAAALFSLTLFLFVPAHVFLVNKSGVMVVFGEVLTGTALISSGVMLALVGILLLLPRPLRRRLTVFLLGVSFLFWIHAYFLVWHYDVLDGSDIPWSSYAGRSLIDIALWILVLLPMQWFAARLYSRVSSACIALIVIQLASLGISSSRSYDSPLNFFKQYFVDNSKVFELSTKRNVLVILVDECQSDVFSEAVLPNPKYRNHFSGFTYFPDTVAGFNFTEFALPAILTGQIYDNGAPREQFLRQAYLENSVPVLLKQQGFSVQLYPWYGLTNEAIYYHEDVASNFKRRPLSTVDKWADILLLLDLGIFRSMPQFAKPVIYNDAQWRLSAAYARVLARTRSSGIAKTAPGAAQPAEDRSSLNLDNALVEFARNKLSPELKMTLVEGTNVFKFYHLAGLHVPIKLRKDLTWGVFDYNRRTYRDQIEAYAIILGAFLDELRRLDVYDNSMIIILGDHGSGRTKDLHVNPGDPQRTLALNQTAIRGDFQRDKARGIPLLLVKRFGEKGDLKTSKVPASLADVPATVLAELGISHKPVDALAGHQDFQGTSVFQLSEDRPRVRYYGAMKWTAERSDFVDAISLYRIQGPAWSDQSWSFVDKLVHQKP